MQPLSLLVARYGVLASRASIVRGSVARAVTEATSVRVAPLEVFIDDGEVRIKVSGARRAALFLAKERAAAAAAAALGKSGVALF
jgi:polysaccharide deacetylase 2 family uncharacterized protein YibQ